ncbi:uncharacterized protein [Palaemon carinicauda]|uniref:uncharacterized protein n=1 Tax=Palaemon carinicauda TaxID=392227 RepID=UPI0035B68CB7
MLREFCVESQLEWDEGIDFLLFAIREVPHESLGFSPYEMLFGRSVRGPLSVIKEEWLNTPSESSQTLQQYMNKLKSTLMQVRKIAGEKLRGQQILMKRNYDKACKVRKFKHNDLVLAYLPVPGSPLKAKFCGPYPIIKNVNNNTYIIKTPDRRKLTRIIHVNLLKAYHSRETGNGSSETVVNLNFKVETPGEDNSLEDLIASSMPQTNTEVLNNLDLFLNHLSPWQSLDLKNVISRHSTLFNDFPRKSDLLLHDIELVPGTAPIRQQSYRVGPEKSKMQEEVEYILWHGLARQSKSPWASPCILVPKEDDASDAGAGGVLLQESDGILHPVSYTSTKFKHHQKSYSTIEKEALSLVLALQKYECYLLGAAEVLVFTDHNPLTFLDKMKSHNQRLLRWSIYLQKFPLQIRHIKGTENIMADALSRLPP